MTRQTLISSFLVLWTLLTHGQTSKITLDSTAFQSKIVNVGWTAEDTTKAQLLLKITTDSVAIVYINWTEGLSGNYCKYTFSTKDNYSSIVLKNCSQSTPSKFIYGYLTSIDNLQILVSDKKLKLNDSILKQADWVAFTRFKE